TAPSRARCSLPASPAVSPRRASTPRSRRCTRSSSPSPAPRRKIRPEWRHERHPDHRPARVPAVHPHARLPAYPAAGPRLGDHRRRPAPGRRETEPVRSFAVVDETGRYGAAIGVALAERQARAELEAFGAWARANNVDLGALARQAPGAAALLAEDGGGPAAGGPLGPPPPGPAPPGHRAPRKPA